MWTPVGSVTHGVGQPLGGVGPDFDGQPLAIGAATCGACAAVQCCGGAIVFGTGLGCSVGCL